MKDDLSKENLLFQKVYAAVRLVPKGKVATYSQIASLCGNCNLRRYVGNALHKNTDGKLTPCHRIVNAKGMCASEFAFGGSDIQKSRLLSEGVEFLGEKVNLEKCLINEDDFEEMSVSFHKIFDE